MRTALRAAYVSMFLPESGVILLQLWHDQRETKLSTVGPSRIKCQDFTSTVLSCGKRELMYRKRNFNTNVT